MKAANSFRALTAVVVAIAGASVALGAGISSIGVLDPGTGTAESAVRAISPDGQYAVGYSNGTATVDTIGGPVTYTGQIPVVWKAGTLTQLPMTADSFGLGRATPTVATGILIRHNTALNRDEIAVGGGFLQTADPFKWQMASYRAPLNNLGSGYWQDNNLGSNAAIVTQNNSARIRTSTAGTTDLWFVAGDRSGSFKDFNMGLSDTNAAYPGSSYEHNGHLIGTETWDAVSNAVNGAGRSAGYIKASNSAPDPLTNPRRATYLNGVNSNVQTPIPGGSQFDSEAVGISPDPNNIILCGFDFSDTTNSKAFVWRPGDAAMTLLNPLAGDTLAGAIDVRSIGGNFITAGYSSNGTLEQATIWDQTGNWDSTGQAKSVLSLLSGAGLDVNGWASLTRVTSMSDDGMTLGGYGVWTDGTTRGFIATIPEPASLLLLSLGGLALLRRNRR